MAQDVSTILGYTVATPRTLNDGGLKGRLNCILDTIEVSDNANADTAVLGLGIPVNARITSIRVATDDLGAAGTMDIGLFKKNADGTFTAVSANAIANDLDVNTAAVTLTERRFSSKDINTVKQKAWELAGLSAEPAYKELFIGMTFDTGTTAAGTLTIIVEFVEIF